MSLAEKRPPVTVETAVQTAISALPSYLGGRRPEGIRVEEVRLPTGDMAPYCITLSYLEAGVEEPRHPAHRAMDGFFTRPPPMERVLRIIEVNADTGAPTGMHRYDRA